MMKPYPIKVIALGGWYGKPGTTVADYLMSDGTVETLTADEAKQRKVVPIALARSP